MNQYPTMQVTWTTNIHITIIQLTTKQKYKQTSKYYAGMFMDTKICSIYLISSQISNNTVLCAFRKPGSLISNHIDHMYLSLDSYNIFQSLTVKDYNVGRAKGGTKVLTKKELKAKVINMSVHWIFIKFTINNLNYTKLCLLFDILPI